MSRADKAPVATYIRNNKRGVFSIQGKEHHPHKLRQGDSIVLEYDLWSTVSGAVRRELMDATATGEITLSTRIMTASGAVLDIPFGGSIEDAIKNHPGVLAVTVAVPAAVVPASTGDGFTVIATGSKNKIESMGLRVSEEQPANRISKSGFTAVSEGRIVGGNNTPPVDNVPVDGIYPAAGVGSVDAMPIHNRENIPAVTVVSATSGIAGVKISSINTFNAITTVAAHDNPIARSLEQAAPAVGAVAAPHEEQPARSITVIVPSEPRELDIAMDLTEPADKAADAADVAALQDDQPVSVPDTPVEEVVEKEPTLEEKADAMYASKAWADLMDLFTNNFPDVQFNRKSVVALKSYAAVKRKYDLPY